MDRFERLAEIQRLRGEGQTLKAIGARFGISRSRVSQILAKLPKPRVDSPPGPATLTDTAVRRLFVQLVAGTGG